MSHRFALSLLAAALLASAAHAQDLLLDRDQMPVDARFVEETQRKADSGNPVSQTWLGIMHYYGKGMDLDIAKAKYWFEAAANQGYAPAMTSLATLYREQKDMQDLDKAFEWYTKAAKKGDANAMQRLGDMYNAGEGVPANPMTAISWYQNAEKARARAAQQDPRLAR